MRGLIIIFVVLLLAVPANAQVVIYDSSPRIIRVPDANARHVAVASPVMTDEEIVERVERRRAQPRRSLAKAPPEAPRPRAELPPANESRRALLSAPPPAVGPGSLTPIYPTPRWRDGDPPPAVTGANTD